MKTYVHAVGGAGNNIVNNHISNVIKSIPHITSSVEFNYIDTADTNIERLVDVEDENIFRLNSGLTGKSVDGAGGNRESLDVYITNFARDYADKYSKVENDLHIIVSSSSGGSGSLLGPRLVSTLKELGKSVVFVTVYDLSSKKYTATTVSALTHIELLGSRRNYTIPTIMVANTDTASADAIVSKATIAIILLAASNIKHLDNADVKAFFDGVYDEASNGLCPIVVTSNVDHLSSGYISSMRVLTDTHNLQLDDSVSNDINQYKFGVIDTDNVLKTFTDILSIDLPFYYALVPNRMNEVIGSIKDRHKQFTTMTTTKESILCDEGDLGVEL